jgi:hypothetical protein
MDGDRDRGASFHSAGEQVFLPKEQRSDKAVAAATEALKGR